MHSKNLKYFLAAILLLVLASPHALSQNDRRSRRQRARGENTEISARDLQIDSLMLHRRDSVARADSLHRADSLALLGKSSLSAPAFSSAGDSIVEKFKDGQRLIYYYGGVTVEHQGMKLTADYMEYDMNTGIVFARGTYDTLAGEWKGRPVMEQGKDKYEMEELRYNFNTRKARITNMSTTDDQGILHGQNLKMFPDRSINITQGRYTVCDDDHPHYYLRMTNAAVITKPTQKTVFGPSFLVLEDVVLPIGLPFGFIPEKPERATGMLMPSFGEENARGFYMRDAGMYFVFGDYLDLSVTGDVYSLGSWAVDVNSRYRVNYKFNGNFSLTYSNDQTGEKGTPDFNQSRNFGVRWSHMQDSKARPGTTFSASVNFSSPSNSRYNSRSVNEALQNQVSSSVSYSHNWNGKVNLSVSGLHSQNSRDSSYTFTLPNVTLSVSTFYPFKQKNRVGSEKIYEKISFGYNTSLQNKINFKASEFNQPGFYDKFQNGMTHSFSIGLPNFTIFKYFNINPGVNYGMNWFFRDTEYRYDEEAGRLVPEKGKAFSTFGVTQTYSGSVSMSTRIYGMLNFGKGSHLQALRHVISPSLSMSISPELGTAANGWRTLVYTDKNGEEQEYSYNRFAGQLNSPPGKGRSATASLSIGNNFEAKVRDRSDTTGVATKKIKLIDQLNLNTGYNFLADSLNLNNIGLTMSTTLFEKVNVSANVEKPEISSEAAAHRHLQHRPPRPRPSGPVDERQRLPLLQPLRPGDDAGQRRRRRRRQFRRLPPHLLPSRHGRVHPRRLALLHQHERALDPELQLLVQLRPQLCLRQQRPDDQTQLYPDPRRQRQHQADPEDGHQLQLRLRLRRDADDDDPGQRDLRPPLFQHRRPVGADGTVAVLLIPHRRERLRPGGPPPLQEEHLLLGQPITD